MTATADPAEPVDTAAEVVDPEPPAAALLGYARGVLDGTVPMPKGRASRAAALLARQALEHVVRARCQAAGLDLDKATMHSRLIALRALAGDREADIAAADRAGAAWAGLSRACHQHAYELAPTTGEVRYLVGLVTALANSR